MDDNQKLLGLFSVRETPLEYIYHYTGEEIANKIRQENTSVFRFSRVSGFSDKTEGACWKKYYSDALEKISKAGIVELCKVSRLQEIIEDKKIPPLYGVSEKGCSINAEYIACFSKSKDDEKLFEEYVEKKGYGKGVCMQFSGRRLKDFRKHFSGYNFYYGSIRYGNENSDYLYELLKNGIEIVGQDEEKFGNCLIILRNFLSKYRFFCKDEKYRWENEYRLLLSVPENMSVSNGGSGEEGKYTYNAEGKTKLDINIPKRILPFLGMHFSSHL